MSKRDWIAVCFICLFAIGLAAWIVLSIGSGLKPQEESIIPQTESSEIKEPALKSEEIIDGLSNVWDVGFLPDNTPVFTERAGTISKVSAGKKVVLHTIGDIWAQGEGGLMGMVVDPDFASNRFMYACYNTPADIRVSRWKVSPDASLLSGQVDIVTGLPVNKTTFPGRHSGCRPRFDARGHLWIGTGDVAIGTHPQDPKSLGAKILRVDRNGQGVTGNLSAPFDPRVFSYGHRNVQGLALFDVPSDDVFGYAVEHGSTRDDEINPLKSGNFGRDPVPGYNDNAPMTDKTKFPEAIGALWSSGEPTIAPSGATFIKGQKWGAYEGQLAVAALKAKQLRVFAFDQAGKITAEKELFQNEFGRLRSAVIGPNNDLYLTTDNGNGADKIIKIVPQ